MLQQSNNPTLLENALDVVRLLFGRYVMLACAFVILAMRVASVCTWACHVTYDMHVA